MQELAFCVGGTRVNRENTVHAGENAVGGTEFSECLLSFQRKMQSNFKVP